MSLNLSAHVRVRSKTGPLLAARNPRTTKIYEGDTGPKTAINEAAGGDEILILPGVYNANLPGVDGTIRCYKPLTIRSSVPGQLATFDAKGAAMSLFYVGVSNTLFDGIGFAGNVQGVHGHNIAALYGVEAFAVSLTVRRCKFWECQHGILNSVGDVKGTVLVEDSEFHDNGNGTGFYHNMYLSAKSVTLRGLWVHDTFARAPAGSRDVNFLSWGHLVKSRAAETIIEGCRLTMEAGEANRCIDLPNGGDATIRGNLLEMIPSANSKGGGQAVSFGVEEGGNPAGHKVHKFRFEQNTLVNHPGTWAGANTRQALFINTSKDGIAAPTEYSIVDNVFAGIEGALVRQIVGAEGQIYELMDTAAANTRISRADMDAMMPGHKAMDFRLATPVLGSRNWATRAYQHPASSVARTDSFRGGAPA